MSILAHRIQLDPTPTQAEFFERACGVSRYTWNWAVAQIDENFKKTGKMCNIPDLQRRWNSEKPAWVYGSPKDANQRPFAHLRKAYSAFFNKQSGKPGLTRKHRCVDSFYISNDKFRLAGSHVRIPLLGLVRLHEPLRLKGKIMGATISRKADRWFISIQVEGEFNRQRTGDGIVGVDLGLKTLATLSDGQTFESPKPLKKLAKRLKHAQQDFSRTTTTEVDGKKVDSKRRAKARTKVQKVYMRIANQRTDFTHKLTNRLCRENQAVVVEDLNVLGMVKNRCLAKAVSDVQFGEFRRQMTYKSALYGTELIVADRWFPSSKTCSCCGRVKDKLSLSERTYRCECGLEMGRDLNAAINLRTLGLRGINARGHQRSMDETRTAIYARPCLGGRRHE